MNNKTMIDETHLADGALERSAAVHLVQVVSEKMGGHQAGLRTQAAHHHGRGRGQGAWHLACDWALLSQPDLHLILTSNI